MQNLPDPDRILLTNTLALFGGKDTTVTELQRQLDTILNSPLRGNHIDFMLADGQLWVLRITQNSLIKRWLFGKSQYNISLNR